MNNLSNQGAASSLTGLLENYRRISRSGTLPEKIQLLRQLVDADSGNQEWMVHLKTLEEKYQNELAAAAKNAILSGNFEELATLHDTFISHPWSHKPNPLVLKKINAVLHRHQLEVVNEKLQEKYAALAEAYGKKDVAALQKILAAYDELLAENPDAAPAADSADAKIVKEIRSYVDKELKQKAEDDEYKRLVESLKYGLLNDQPIAQVEKYIIAIRSMDRAVPMDLNQRFLACQEEEELVLRRKKVMRVIVGAVISLIVLAILGTAGYFGTMHYMRKSYCSRLEAVVASGVSAEGFAILDELASRFPTIRNDRQIKELEKKLGEKKAAEDVKRSKFQFTAKDTEAKLHQFEKYRQDFTALFKTMEENIVDDQEQNVYNKLKQQYEAASLDFRQQRSTEYRQKAADLQRAYSLYNAAVAERNPEEARKQITVIRNLKTALRKMDDVPEEVKKEFEEVLKKEIDFHGDMKNLEAKLRERYEEERFHKNVAELEKLSSLFNVAIGKKQLADAVRYFERISTLLNEIESMTSLPQELLVQYDDLLKSFDNCEREVSKLQKEKEELARLSGRRDEIMTALKESKKFADFADVTDGISPADANLLDQVMPGLSLLQENCHAARMILAGKYESIPLFVKDIGKLNELKRQRIASGEKIIRDIRKWEEDLDENRMIVLCNLDGRLCSLYFSKQANRSADEYNIRLHDVEMDDLMGSMTVEYDPQNNSVRVSYRGEFNFTGTLIYPEKFSINAPSLPRIYDDKLLKAIDKDSEAAIENAEKLLCDNIKAIIDDQRIHPGLKYQLIAMRIQILKSVFPDRNSSYSLWAQELEKISSQWGDLNWRMTGSKLDIESANRELKEFYEKFSGKFPYQKSDMQIAVLEIIKQRKLVPAGFVINYRDEKGKAAVEFHRFENAPAAGEFWVISGGRFQITGEYTGNHANFLPSGSGAEVELVFTPTDGKSTAELQQQIEGRGEKLPDSWPLTLF